MRLGWMLVTIFVVAVLFNYPWELAQLPLYVGIESFSAMWWHCFVASLGDSPLVLLIFAAGWVALYQQDWFVQPGAWLCDDACCRAYDRRQYRVDGSTRCRAMGVHGTDAALLGLGVGVVPVMQMLILPPLIFRFVALLLRVRF